MSDKKENEYRYRVRLLIKHPNMNPASITEQLGLIPQLSQNASGPRCSPTGERLPGAYDASAWGYSYIVESSRSFFADVGRLLDHLEPHAEFLSRITTTGGTVRIIVHVPGEINIGDVIESSTLNRLAKLGVDLGVEVFPGFAV